MLRSKDETAHTALQAWQRRAQDAEHKLYQVYSSLLALPDPAPFLYLLASLASRVQGMAQVNLLMRGILNVGNPLFNCLPAACAI